MNYIRPLALMDEILKDQQELNHSLRIVGNGSLPSWRGNINHEDSWKMHTNESEGQFSCCKQINNLLPYNLEENKKCAENAANLLDFFQTAVNLDDINYGHHLSSFPEVIDEKPNRNELRYYSDNSFPVTPNYGMDSDVARSIEMGQSYIMGCVNNWKLKYPWTTFHELKNLFTCSSCRGTPFVFQMNNLMDIHLVSAKLLKHESSVSHIVSLFSAKPKGLLIVITYVKFNAWKFSNRNELYIKLILYLKERFGIKADENMLNVLITDVARRLEKLQLKFVNETGRNGISFRYDECRQLLITRTLNSDGFPEENLIVKAFEHQSLQSWSAALFPDLMYRTSLLFNLTENGTEFKSSSDVDFISVPISINEIYFWLEKDPVIWEYKSCIKILESFFALDSVFLPVNRQIFGHWSKLELLKVIKVNYLPLLSRIIAKKLSRVTINRLAKAFLPENLAKLEKVLKILESFSDTIKSRQVQMIGSSLDKDLIYTLLDEVKMYLSPMSVLAIEEYVKDLERHNSSKLSFKNFEVLFHHRFLINIQYETKFFEMLQNYLPNMNKDIIMTDLREFGHYLYNNQFSDELDLFTILTIFRRDKYAAANFPGVSWLYKMVSLFPCFSAYSLISPSSVWRTYSLFQNTYGKAFALQLLQIDSAKFSALETVVKSQTHKQ